jgi:RimJ/RimL family protein N-acetyltransferase
MTKRIALPIETERLLLRDFVAADLEAVHGWRSDPEVTRNMFYGPDTLPQSRSYLAELLEYQEMEQRPGWELAIERKADGRVIGACDVTLSKMGTLGDVGYALARDAWGSGYATEAARAMVAAGFEQLGVWHMVGICDPANEASGHVLAKAGLLFEEDLPKNWTAKGRLWDIRRYGITREAWFAGRERSRQDAAPRAYTPRDPGR